MAKAPKRIEELAREAAEAHGLVVDDIVYGQSGKKALLRIVIDHADWSPVGITDCEAVSKDLAAILDVEDAIKSQYTLEVTSPGIERPLRKPDDFRRAVGKLARVVTKAPVDGRTFFMGRLLEAGEKEIRLAEEKAETAIGYGMITKARLEPEWKIEIK